MSAEDGVTPGSVNFHAPVQEEVHHGNRQSEEAEVTSPQSQKPQQNIEEIIEEDRIRVSLASPAPKSHQIESRSSSWAIKVPGFRWERQVLQLNQCIRSQILIRDRNTSSVGNENAISLGDEIVDTSAALRTLPFPWPRKFTIPEAPFEENMQVETRVGTKLEFGCFGSYEISVGQERRQNFRRSERSSTYIVVGLFRRQEDQPIERIVFISKSEQVFQSLKWGIIRLRGWHYLFSLKAVNGFKLYTCNAETGVHNRVELDQRGTADIRLFLAAYSSRNVLDQDAYNWGRWIHACLNQNSPDIRASGTYSLEVTLGWSAFRISLAILIPVLLSLAIGIWFNQRDWTDLATIQTAWGIASYIATAGGLVAAMLGIISGLADT